MEYMVGDYDALSIDGGVYDGRRMSRLSIESMDCNDTDVELSDYEKGPGPEPEPELEDDDDDDDDDDEEEEEEEEDEDEDDEDEDAPVGAVSLPGTPEKKRRAGASQLIWVKDYASDVDVDVGAKGKGKGKGRDRWLDLAWELRKCREAVLERPLSMRMDVYEVKACQDLGLGLPCHCDCDWTVEIPTCAFSANTNTISSPGDDPKDVKARLRSWAQAVALASATRLTC